MPVGVPSPAPLETSATPWLDHLLATTSQPPRTATTDGTLVIPLDAWGEPGPDAPAHPRDAGAAPWTCATAAAVLADVLAATRPGATPYPRVTVQAPACATVAGALRQVGVLVNFGSAPRPAGRPPDA